MSAHEVELRRIVERIVRPVVAAQWRKQRMREELLAHVHSIFEQQSELSRNEQTAMAEASKRLGNPSQLTDSLQATIPRIDRLWLFLEGKTLPTVWQAGLKFALIVSFAYFAVFVPVGALSLAYGVAPGRDLLLLSNSPLSLAFVLLMPVWSLLIAMMMWMMDRMQIDRSLAWPPKSPRQLAAEIWAKAYLRTAVLLGASAFVVALLRVQSGSQDAIGITMLLCSLAALGVPVAWSLTQDVYAKRRKTQVWSSLVID